MVEPKIHSRLDYTLILCIYKVFKHLHMLLIGIWMYRYAIIVMEWVELADFGKTLGTNHTSMTWLSPRATPDWIKLSSYVYIKCLSTFPCCGLTYECILTYAIIAMEGGRTCWFWANTWYKPHNYDMVETKTNTKYCNQ